MVTLHFPCCVQVAVASKDPSVLGGHRNKSQSSGPARTAAQPGAAQPSSPLHLYGQPEQYDPPMPDPVCSPLWLINEFAPDMILIL